MVCLLPLSACPKLCQLEPVWWCPICSVGTGLAYPSLSVACVAGSLMRRSRFLEHNSDVRKSFYILNCTWIYKRKYLVTVTLNSYTYWYGQTLFMLHLQSKLYTFWLNWQFLTISNLSPVTSKYRKVKKQLNSLKFTTLIELYLNLVSIENLSW